jgi:hydrogenase maturation protease
MSLNPKAGNMTKPIRVICCGSPLRGDDAVGLEVYKRLKFMDLPKNVELIDGGTAGLDLLLLFDGSSSVILVDGIITDHEAGHVQWFSGEEVMAQNPVRLSGHEIDLGQVLRIWYTNMDSESEISLLGISIKNLELGCNTISPPVAAGVDRASKEILKRLRKDSND